jgi:hypothetical protein
VFRSRASLQAEVLTLRQQLNAAAEGTGETGIPERAIGHQMQKNCGEMTRRYSSLLLPININFV